MRCIGDRGGAGVGGGTDVLFPGNLGFVRGGISAWHMVLGIWRIVTSYPSAPVCPISPIPSRQNARSGTAGPHGRGGVHTDQGCTQIGGLRSLPRAPCMSIPVRCVSPETPLGKPSSPAAGPSINDQLPPSSPTLLPANFPQLAQTFPRLPPPPPHCIFRLDPQAPLLVLSLYSLPVNLPLF